MTSTYIPSQHNMKPRNPIRTASPWPRRDDELLAHHTTGIDNYAIAAAMNLTTSTVSARINSFIRMKRIAPPPPKPPLADETRMKERTDTALPAYHPICWGMLAAFTPTIAAKMEEMMPVTVTHFSPRA